LLLVYAVSGALAGLAGLLWVGRYAIAFTELAAGYELTVIAACVIGGVSIGGGVGSVAGAVLGVLFIGVVNGALPVIQVSPFWQQAIAGAVILVSVALNARSQRQAGRQILEHASHASHDAGATAGSPA
jgi:rhamnose transport system permease protein